jgi:hypothetical protein
MQLALWNSFILSSKMGGHKMLLGLLIVSNGEDYEKPLSWCHIPKADQLGKTPYLRGLKDRHFQKLAPPI